MMRIQHNISSMNTYRQLSGTTSALSKNLEKLSSGYKINRAGDDAAGLAMSEKMRLQITGLDRAQKNAREGVDLVKTVEGALQEVHDMLNRVKYLATQSSNGTYAGQDRMALDDEVQALKTEIDRIGETANFNGIHLFKGTNSSPSMGTSMTFQVKLDLTSQVCEIVSPDAASTSSTDSTNTVPDGYKLLAEKIAAEYVPNAVSQIFAAFPSLKAAVGGDSIELTLNIENIDGASNTLATAGVRFSYTNTDANVVSMELTVDTSDFSDASISDSSPDVEMLESTLAHELMHTVMQYTMTEEMVGRGDATEFPTWFVEGTAQLAGGGFPTNWNHTLETIAGQLTGANDTGQDTNIENYLKAHTASNRPYGHGYLAAAYLGYLASGQGGDVTGAKIAAGMDKIFADIIANETSLYTAISNATGLSISSSSDVDALFTNPSTGLVEFVRQLSYNTKGGGNDGGGSVIAASLATGGSSILGSSAGSQAFYVGNISVSTGGRPAAADSLQLTVGLDGQPDVINVELFEMNSDALGLSNTNVLTVDSSSAAIGAVTTAINTISSIRGYYGAMQNRLEHTINNIGVMYENLTDAESVIRDTNMAEEMMAYTRNQILLQSGQAMLSQANMVPNGVLSLIRS